MTRPVQHTAAAVAGWLREGRRVVAGLLVEVEGSSPLDVGASHVHRRPGRDRGLDHRRLRRGRGRRGGDGDARRPTAAPQLVDLRHLRRARRHGRADVRRDRPHLHPRAQAATRARRSCRPAGDDRPHARRARHAARRRARRRQALRRRRAAPPARSAAASCSTRTPRARPQGLLAEGRSSHARLRHRRRRRSAPACASTPRSRPSRRGWSSSARSTSPARSRRWPRASATASRSPTRAPPSSKSRRFSAAAETEVGWPDKVLDGVELGPRDAVLIFTHDPKLDVPAVQAALGTGAGYIGALGSRNTTADRNRRLRDVGVTDERDRAHLRALRAGHRRLDRRGDRRRRAGRDHRPPCRAPRTTAAGGRRADPPRGHRPTKEEAWPIPSP